jgi:hypothetical protein
MRKIKTMGIALIAVFALAAVAASAAQAAPAEFGWASGTTKIERSANTVQEFTVPGIGSFKCNEVIAFATGLTGTGAASVTTDKKSLTYNDTTKGSDKCPASIGTATITTHECRYQFTPGTSTGTGTSAGTVDIVNCPTTAPIEVNVAGVCIVTISNQTGLGPVAYSTNAGPPTSVTITPNITNIAWSTSTTPKTACGVQSGTNATYAGDVTVIGTNSGGTQTAVSIKP